MEESNIKFNADENNSNKLTPEKLWEFSKKIHKLKKLRERSSDLTDRFCIAVQMEYLCKDGKPKKARLLDKYVRGKKQICTIITNKKGKEFIYPMEDVPHELRAYLLKKYSDVKYNKLPELFKYKKLGWFKPYPDYEKEEN